MFRSIFLIGLAMILVVGLAACGGGEQQAASNEEPGSDDTAMDTSTPQEDAAEASQEQEPPAQKYETEEDPNAVYTRSDINMEGSWLKINLEDLSDDQLNRALHRARTEYCTCGCPEDTIDECMVNDPSCGTAVTLMRQIIREEKLKG